jgi:hypothetical protein
VVFWARDQFFTTQKPSFCRHAFWFLLARLIQGLVRCGRFMRPCAYDMYRSNWRLEHLLSVPPHLPTSTTRPISTTRRTPYHQCPRAVQPNRVSAVGAQLITMGCGWMALTFRMRSCTSAQSPGFFVFALSFCVPHSFVYLRATAVPMTPGSPRCTRCM